MEHKARYCPQCGSKTNDMHCDICERLTKPIEERYKEKDLDLVADDIASFDHIQSTHKVNTHIYENNPKETQEDLDSVSQNVSMHAFKNRKSNSKTSSSSRSYQQVNMQNDVLMKIIGIIIVGIIGFCIFLLMGSV
ncbi:MAG: hypothetical protein RR690_03840 [Longicatena sp.]